MSRVTLFLAILGMCLTVGCRRGVATSSDEAASSATRTVAVIQPQRRDVTQSITLPGDLVGYYEAALHSKVTGYLTKVMVDKGDWVKQGQVLATLEVPELDQNLARARARLQIA